MVDTSLGSLQLPAKLHDFARVLRAHRDDVVENLQSDWTIKVKLTTT